MSRSFWLVITVVMLPSIGAAQGSAVINPVYRKAQTLVNDGNATAGRALVDSMINVASPGTNDYAEGIFWRAVLAATAADAEMDYRRILVDYSQSPRVDDALIRLAQLEIARSNYDGALRHLNALVADHPQSPWRGRAGYWTARALFDKNDIRGGCIALADALARTTEDDAELRNQISYLNQRCAGVVLTPPVQAAVIPAPIQAGRPVDSTKSAPPDTVKVGAPPPSTASVRPPEKPSQKQPLTKTTPVEHSIKVESTLVVKPSPGKTTLAKTGTYSVQVAAYNVKSQAAAMVVKLKKKGYEARVDGEKAPFRIRIGNYATQAQASAVQRSLKAKQIDGFVVQPDTQ